MSFAPLLLRPLRRKLAPPSRKHLSVRINGGLNRVPSPHMKMEIRDLLRRQIPLAVVMGTACSV